MIHGIEKRPLAGLRSGPKDFEVSLGRRVEKKSLSVPVLLDSPEVSRLSPQDVLSINKDGPGRTEPRMLRVNAEPLQIHHPQAFHHLPGSGTAIKIKTRSFGPGNFSQNPLQFVLEGNRKLDGFQADSQSLREPVFPWVKENSEGEKIMRVFPTAEDELAGRQIKPGRPNSLAIQFEGEQKMITASIQLPILQDGSGRKDAGNARA